MIKTYLFTKDGISQDVPLDNWRALVDGECRLLWVHVNSLDEDTMHKLAELFGLHSVAVEACLDAFRRPYLHEFQDHLYVNLTSLARRGNAIHTIKPAELNLFVGEKYIITASKDDESDAVNSAISEYIETSSLCERGSMFAVYKLVEDLVGTYLPIVDKLDEEADKLENLMLDRADKSSLRKLFALKRKVFDLRKLLGPQRDIFNELTRHDFPFVTGDQQIYFHDVYNRMIRVFDMLDTIRDILSGSLDIYLSTVSNRLNEVMKVLTVAATILMTLSFITGFYGMNFVYLPWLKAPNAFRNVTVIMVVITAGMFWWFKRKKMV
jgi:magnesium transporter